MIGVKPTPSLFLLPWFFFLWLLTATPSGTPDKLAPQLVNDAHGTGMAICALRAPPPPCITPNPCPLRCTQVGIRIRAAPTLTPARHALGLWSSVRWLDCPRAAAASAHGGRIRLWSATGLCFEPRGPLGALHLIKHAVRLPLQLLAASHRCARQRHTLELHQGADGSGTGPVDVLTEAVATGGRH